MILFGIDGLKKKPRRVAGAFVSGLIVSHGMGCLDTLKSFVLRWIADLELDMMICWVFGGCGGSIC